MRRAFEVRTKTPAVPKPDCLPGRAHHWRCGQQGPKGTAARCTVCRAVYVFALLPVYDFDASIVDRPVRLAREDYGLAEEVA